MPTLTGTSHVDLTVSDLDRSSAFYQEVLGLSQLVRMRSEEGKFEVAYFIEPASSMILGLVKHDAGNAAKFDQRLNGLDHLSFAVADREELEAWAEHLSAGGIENSGLTDQPPFGTGLNFVDPDGIALEFYHLLPLNA